MKKTCLFFCLFGIGASTSCSAMDDDDLPLLTLMGNNYQGDCFLQNSEVEILKYREPVAKNNGFMCWINTSQAIIVNAPTIGSLQEELKNKGYELCDDKQNDMIACAVASYEQPLETSTTFAVMCEGEACMTDEVEVHSYFTNEQDAVRQFESGGRTIGPDVDDEGSWGIRTLRMIRDSNPGGSLESVFVVEFNDPAQTDFGRSLKAVTDQSSRSALIQTRKNELYSVREGFRQAFSDRGLKVVSEFWIDNSIAVTASLDLLEDIIAYPNVIAVWPTDDNAATNNVWYDGATITNSVQSEIYSDYGYWGEGNGRVQSPTDNMKIGFVEFDEGLTINENHLGWLDYVGGGTRVKKTRLCFGSGCIIQINTTGLQTHIQGTASVAAGSIEQGQDPAYPGSNTLQQRRRSGIAQEAEIYAYLAASNDSTLGYKKAIEELIGIGVDVINSSASFTSNPCSRSYNPGGIASAILGAKNAGVPLVVSSGNTSAGACSVQFPAYLPYVVSVGAVETNNTNVDYAVTPRASYSAYGNLLLTDRYGIQAFSPAVSLVAPGNIRYRLGAGTDGYSSFSGTSASTPVVTGITALLIEWMRDNGLGFAASEVEVIHATLGVFGDGANGPTTKTRTRVDREYGFGRIKAQLPLASLGGQGSILAHRIIWNYGTISSGQTIQYALSRGCGGWIFPCPDTIEDFKGLKSAIIIEDPANNMTYVPNVEYSVVDLCNNNAILKQADTLDYLKKRMRIYDYQTRLHGTCPWVQIKILDAGYVNVKYASVSYLLGDYAGVSDPWTYH